MTQRQEMYRTAARLDLRAAETEARAGRRYDRAHRAHVRLAARGYADQDTARLWSRAWRAAGDRLSARADRLRAEAEDIRTELADTELGPDDAACTYSAR